MSRRRRFEQVVLPHLDGAYNLARWLLRDTRAAEDVVQEATLRAWRYFDALRGDEARPWLLGIVRNTCFDALQRQRSAPDQVEFDESIFQTEQAAGQGMDPAAALGHARLRLRVDAAIRALAPPLREVIVLRELEELEYAEIARVAGVPIGTVMSRLSRARARLREVLSDSRMDERDG